MSEPSTGELIRDLRSAKRFFRPDWEKRIAAARRLGELRAAQAVGDLAAVIDENESAELCQAAVQALGQIADGSAAKTLALLLKKNRRDLHPAAIDALEQIGSEQAVAALVGAWESVSTTQKETISQSLVRLGPERAAGVLVAALGHSSPAVQQQSEKVLLQFPSSVPRLIMALAHEDSRVRAGARALLVQRGIQAVPDLVAALGHADDRVSEGAVEALVQIGAPAVEPLISIAIGEDEKAAQAAANALVRIERPAVKPLIAASTSSPQAITILLRIKEPAKAILKDTSADDEALLLTVLGYADVDLQESASKKLAEIGATEPSSLLTMLDSQNYILAEGTAFTLSRMEDVALQPLIEALGDPAQQAESARSLVQIARLAGQYADRHLAARSDDSFDALAIQNDRETTQTCLLLALGQKESAEARAQSLRSVLQEITASNSQEAARQLLPLVMGRGAILAVITMIMSEPGPGLMWPPERVQAALNKVKTGLQGILHLDPKMSIAHCWRGDIHAILGQVREAIAGYEQSLELGIPTTVEMPIPSWQEVHNQAAANAQEEGKTWPALPIFSPWEENAEARFYFRMGMFHMSLAEPNNLWHILAERRQTNPNLPPHERDWSHYRLAVPYFEQAINLELVTARIGSGEMDIEDNLGFCAWMGCLTTLKQCEWQETLALLQTAQRAYEHYLARHADGPKAADVRDSLQSVNQQLARYQSLGDNEALWQFERGALLLTTQEYDIARQAFQASIEAGLAEIQDQVQGQLEASLETDNDTAKEIVAGVLVQLAEAEVARQPGDAQAQERFGRVCIEMATGDAKGVYLDKAIHAFEQAMALGGDEDRLSGLLADAAFDTVTHYLLENEHLDRILPLIRQGIACTEKHLRAYEDEKNLAGRADDLQKILAELDDVDSNEAAFLQRLRGGMVYQHYAQARQMAAAAKASGKATGETEQALVAMMQQMGEEGMLRGIAALKEAIRLKPDYGGARHVLSDALQQMERYDEAAGILEEGIRLSPGYWQLYFSLGDIQATELDQAQAAIQTYQKGLAINPSWAVGHRALGAAYFATEQYAQAISSLEMALRLDPNVSDTHSLLAWAHLLNGNIADGTRQSVIAVREEPVFLAIYLTWLESAGGEMLQSLGKRGRCTEALELLDLLTVPLQAARIGESRRTTVAQIYVKLWLWSSDIMNTYDVLEGYDAAIRLLEQALQLDESAVPRLRRTLAEVVSDKGRHFYRKGRCQEGLSWAEKAIEIDQTCDPAWATAAMCYQGLGKPRDALHCLEAAARLGNVEARNFLRQLGG